MAKRTGYIIGGVFMMMFCASLFAQQKTNAKPDAKKATKEEVAKVKKVAVRPRLYLGNSDFSGGKIKAKTFDSLLRQGIHSHDSLGNQLQVIGFNFNYAERRLYEDSVGDPKWEIDFSTEYCPGDTITPGIAETIYSRIKHGDTVFIEQAVVVRAGKKNSLADTTLGHIMKCEITR